jgi:integrase
MIHSSDLPRVKGLRMSRKKGEGEGSLKKDGGVWRGRWVQWIGDQQKRPKISFPVANFPTKREARDELNRLIREASGCIGPLPQAPTFADIWQRYFTLKKPHWSKPQIGAVEPIMRRAVLPQIGERDIARFTPEPLQAALNHMAEMPLLIGTRKETQYTRIGYGESALKTARTYIRAVFEFALDEGIIQRNPAKRLELPPARKVCERFLSLEEVHTLIAAAAGREKLVLRLFLVAGLRPAELFALKTDDIMPGQLRIDEAIKEREKQATGRRLGDTKTETSDTVVPITTDLEAKLREWADLRPAGALLFPSDRGTTWRLGNYLKRVLKPLAASVGISDVTHQCLRRTCATHFKGDVKDRQTHMRHADPATTLKHYQKTIPESQRVAVEALDKKFLGLPETPPATEKIQ